MADVEDWDADNFEPEEPIKKAAVLDKWEGEDEDEDVKTKVSEKKKLSEKIKEKENQLRKKQEELKKEMEKVSTPEELTPEEQLAEKLRVQQLQEAADLELAKDAFGVNPVSGIDAMCPSSKEDFTEFEKLLKEKITQFEKSVHYSSFLDSFDLYFIFQQNKGKKKKKGVVPGGGLKAQMRDELDYAEFDGGYAQDYEDFM
uniref:Eukaryotic translation initiation factor 3, subunit Jb n=1 Tax=Cyprinodon variegatus TaxID=28743 RepID=A0A3Q2D6P6_CYPVA